MRFILNKISIVILLVLFVAIGMNFALAASKEDRILDLRQQIEELTRQAEQFRKNVLDKQQESNTLSREISIINNQISALQAEINRTSNEIETTEIEIVDLEGQIFDTGQTIDTHKRTLSELMVSMYERDQMGMVVMLLSNEHLSDFADEAQQIETLNAQLSKIVTDLKEQKNFLEDNKNELSDKRGNLLVLNDQQFNQRNSLGSSRNQKDNVLSETKGEEKKYQELLNEAEQKKAQFFQELQALESEARETGTFIVHVTASNVPARGTELYQWPYEKFVNTQGYGYTAYANRGAYGGAPHNGIDIVSGYASPIRSIGDGNVLTAGFNNGFGNWVAIQHDNGMVSLYAHMNSPARLGNGTDIKAGDTIGFEGSTGNSTGSHLHLSLYTDFFTYIRQSNGQIYFNYFDGTVNPFDYLVKR
ncbi:MAG: peptidoglycan DD-metalloendopeptidase family protein [Parcubacteria group bacterium]